MDAQVENPAVDSLSDADKAAILQWHLDQSLKPTDVAKVPVSDLSDEDKAALLDWHQQNPQKTTSPVSSPDLGYDAVPLERGGSPMESAAYDKASTKNINDVLLGATAEAPRLPIALTKRIAFDIPNAIAKAEPDSAWRQGGNYLGQASDWLGQQIPDTGAGTTGRVLGDVVTPLAALKLMKVLAPGEAAIEGASSAPAIADEGSKFANLVKSMAIGGGVGAGTGFVSPLNHEAVEPAQALNEGTMNARNGGILGGGLGAIAGGIPLVSPYIDRLMGKSPDLGESAQDAAIRILKNLAGDNSDQILGNIAKNQAAVEPIPGYAPTLGQLAAAPTDEASRIAQFEKSLRIQPGNPFGLNAQNNKDAIAAYIADTAPNVETDFSKSNPLQSQANSYLGGFQNQAAQNIAQGQQDLTNATAQAENSKDAIKQAIQDQASQVLPSPDNIATNKAAASAKIQDNFQNLYDSATAAKNKLYSDVAQDPTLVPTTPLKNAILEISQKSPMQYNFALSQTPGLSDQISNIVNLPLTAPWKDIQDINSMLGQLPGGKNYVIGALKNRVDDYGNLLANNTTGDLQNLGNKILAAQSNFADNYAPLFKQGAGGNIVDQMHSFNDMNPSDFANNFLKSDSSKGSFENIQQYQKMFGDNPPAMQDLREYMLHDLSQKITSNGEYMPKRMDSWIDSHRSALEQDPDFYGQVKDLRNNLMGLSDNLSKTGDNSAQQAFAQILKNNNDAAIAQKMEATGLSKFLGKDPESAISQIANSDNKATLTKTMMTSLKDNPEATDVVKKLYADNLRNQFGLKGQSTSDGEMPLSFAKVQAFMADNSNQRALSNVLGQDALERVNTVQEAMRQMVKADQLARATNNSDTVANLLNNQSLQATQDNATAKNLMSNVLGLFSRKLTGTAIPGKMLAGSISPVENPEITKVLTEAFLNPHLFETLVKTPTPANAPLIRAKANMIMGATYGTKGLLNQNMRQQNESGQ